MTLIRWSLESGDKSPHPKTLPRLGTARDVAPAFGLRRFIAAFACLLLLAGCSHYQLGTGAAPGFRTLYIAPVTNATMLPQSVALVSTQLRQQFARDARISLVNSPADADATLTVALTHYGREIAAARSDDTGLARKFNLSLQATCTLRETRSGKLIFENRVATAQREAFTDGGQLQSEYQALPLLAEALANKVVHAALDVW